MNLFRVIFIVFDLSLGKKTIVRLCTIVFCNLYHSIILVHREITPALFKFHESSYFKFLAKEGVLVRVFTESILVEFISILWL